MATRKTNLANALGVGDWGGGGVVPKIVLALPIPDPMEGNAHLPLVAKIC